MKCIGYIINNYLSGILNYVKKLVLMFIAIKIVYKLNK